MAQIIIDARKYFDFGIGAYIRHLVAGLAKLHSRHSFCLLVSPGDENKIAPPKGWSVEVISYGKYSMSEFFLMGRKVKSLGKDALFHSPHYTLPLGLRRSVVTIHDVIPLRLPQFFSMIQRAYAYAMIGHAVKAARFVMPGSESARQDILRLFGAHEEKVICIHHAISSKFRPLPQKEKKKFRATHGITRPYVLFVGNPKQHKGISTLLRAFERIAGTIPEVDLVFVGGRSVEELVTTTVSRERLKMLGQVSDEDLVGAYNCAEILIMPSLYEGFGLPPLEAMACGTPVISSQAGSLPEVVGDAAMFFRTGDSQSLADAMKLLLHDHELRSTMISRGKKQVRRFSWKETAKRTLEVYEKALADQDALPHTRK